MAPGRRGGPPRPGRAPSGRIPLPRSPGPARHAMTTLSVFYPEPPAPAEMERLRERLDPRVLLRTGPALPEPADFEVLVCGRPSEAQLDASPRLRLLVIPWAGLPEGTRPLLLRRPAIAVCNLHHNAAATAETAAALLLAAAKFLVPMDRALRAGDWSPRYEASPSVILDGARALLLGYGEVGRRVARICRGLGMEVRAVRRRPGAAGGVQADPAYPPEALHGLLPSADALLVTLPLTERTRGMIGEREIALLPPRAVLVNVGRAAVVDERALYEALRDGRLRAAGLDVWYRYPAAAAERTATLPSAFPFHQLGNVVMSPHRGGHPGTEGVERLRMDALAAALNAAAACEPVPHPVDVAEGY